MQAELDAVVHKSVALSLIGRIRLDTAAGGRGGWFEAPRAWGPVGVRRRTFCQIKCKGCQAMLCFLLFMIFMMHSIIVHAEDYTTDDKTPDEIKPFIEKGMHAIATESADLNGDGLKDYVLVMETEYDNTNDHEQTGRQRVLLILVRHSDGALEVVKRNDKIIYCSTCGGAAFGDSFEGVSVGPKTFTVHAYGGSA